ncbi:Detected protein of confused Function [Hibiscus syriacus]|uniref:Detected protein of confused Function n=1 Tax=Hibiscus syriacus TaxID=106335 RepID=A0A6A2WUM5_HIBSY|nr:Detected protein of confused Function [Hibiscus syriacus]
MMEIHLQKRLRCIIRGGQNLCLTLRSSTAARSLAERYDHLTGELRRNIPQREIVTWKSKLNTEKREVSKLQDRIAMLKNSLSDRDHEIRDLKIALRDWEARGRSLEEDIRKAVNDKRESEETLRGEIEHLRLEIAERSDCIKDNQIVEMDKHLQELNVEHVELIASAEGANKLVEELESKAKELEDVIERQRIKILEGAEEKREVIRQLCFSLEHYQDRGDRVELRPGGMLVQKRNMGAASSAPMIKIKFPMVLTTMI